MDSTKAIYGLVGKNIQYSLSPVMHNAAFEALQVDAVYELFSLKEDELDSFFNEIKKESSQVYGLNVTVPYKEKALRFLDSFSPMVEKIKAVNTIVVTKQRKLIGHNTDAPGFLAHLGELVFDIKGKQVALLGAGGASRAIVSALCLMPSRLESIKIFDIERDKAISLIDDLGKRLDISNVKIAYSIDDLDIDQADLLINATPIGSKKEDPCLIEKELLHSDMLVYDLVYNPAETPLLKMAKECGAKTSNGLGMLFYQGVLAFQHWADLQLDQNIKDIMRQRLEEKVF